MSETLVTAEGQKEKLKSQFPIDRRDVWIQRRLDTVT